MSAIHYLGDHDNSTGSVLMRHIRDNPDDETGKLVLADWLMENGHPEVGNAIHMHHNQQLRERGDVLPFGEKWKGIHKDCNYFFDNGSSHSTGDGSGDPVGGINGHFYTSTAYDSDLDKELPKLANVSLMLRMPKAKCPVWLADFKTPHLDIAKSISDELIDNERPHERQDATDRGRDELKANFDKHCDQHGSPESPRAPQEAKQMAKKKSPDRFNAKQIKTPEFKNWFGDYESSPESASKVVDESGLPKRVYHGTQRPDRVGDTFLKSRATSGPMSMFTDSPEIANGYATGKRDTSYQSPDNYDDWFKAKPYIGRGEVNISNLWYHLTPEEKLKVSTLAPRVSRNNEYEIALEPEGHKSGLGAYDQHLREARGNHLKALVEEWLTSGALFNDEQEFHNVLSLAGLGREVKMHDPHAAYPAIYPTYLSIKNPLVTSQIPKDVVDELQRIAYRQRTKPSVGADMWAKTIRDAREWVSQLKEDLASGKNSYVWTSIPDWVTRVLKRKGYDGIHDDGGKGGGERHSVYIPFESHQIKSATGNSGRFDSNKKNIRMKHKKSPSRFAESEQPAFESTGTQLLRHIAENPDDETGKLVYADWLEENGYPETAGAIRMHHDKRLRENGDVVDDGYGELDEDGNHPTMGYEHIDRSIHSLGYEHDYGSLHQLGWHNLPIHGLFYIARPHISRPDQPHLAYVQINGNAGTEHPIKLASFYTPHLDVAKQISQEIHDNSEKHDKATDHDKANKNGMNEFARLAEERINPKPAKMSKRHQQAAKDILSKHSKLFSSNCEKQKDGEYLCKGDSSEPGEVADQFARASAKQLGYPLPSLGHGADLDYEGINGLFHGLRGPTTAQFTLHTDQGGDSGISNSGKNRDGSPVLGPDGKKAPKPWNTITKLSRVTGKVNASYAERKKEELAKLDPPQEYIPGPSWHEKDGAFGIHKDGARHVTILDPVDDVEPRYFGQYTDEHGNTKYHPLEGEELEHAVKFLPAAKRQAFWDAQDAKSRGEPTPKEPGEVSFIAPAFQSIKKLVHHGKTYNIRHEDPIHDSADATPKAESATPPKSIEPPMPARTPEKPSRPETAPTLPMAAKIAPDASGSERKPMPEFEDRKTLRDMQDEPRKKIEPDDSDNDVSVDKEEPSHIERITKGFHPTIAGTRLAHHLDKIRTEFAGDDRIAELANRAISGDWKTGNDPDVFKQLGEALKEKGSPWGTAYRWGQAYKGLQLDGKIKDMVDKKLKGGQGNHYRKLALMLGEYMRNPTAEHKFQSDPRWKEFYDGMIKTTQESLHSDKFPGRNVDALGALYRSLLRNGFREEDREDAKNDPDYKKGFDYLPGWQGGPSQADKATHNAERFQKKPDVPPPLPPSGKKPIQTPDHLYPDKSKPAQPPLPSSYMPKQSPVGKEIPKKFANIDDYVNDAFDNSVYNPPPPYTDKAKNKAKSNKLFFSDSEPYSKGWGDYSESAGHDRNSLHKAARDIHEKEGYDRHESYYEASRRLDLQGKKKKLSSQTVANNNQNENNKTTNPPPPVPANANSQRGTQQDLADYENDIKRTGGQTFAPMASPLPRPQPNGRTPFREPTPQEAENAKRQTQQDIENRKKQVKTPVYDIPITVGSASTPPPLPKGYVPKTSPAAEKTLKPRNPNPTTWHSPYTKGVPGNTSGNAGYVSHSNPESKRIVDKAKADGMHVATVYQPMPDGTRKPVTSYIGRTPEEAKRLGELHIKLTKLKRDAQKESGSKSPRDIWKSGGGKYWNQAKPILEEMRKLLGKPASPGKKFNPETGHNEREHPGLPVEGSKLILSKRHQPNKRGHRK